MVLTQQEKTTLKDLLVNLGNQNRENLTTNLPNNNILIDFLVHIIYSDKQPIDPEDIDYEKKRKEHIHNILARIRTECITISSDSISEIASRIIDRIDDNMLS